MLNKDYVLSGNEYNQTFTKPLTLKKKNIEKKRMKALSKRKW